MEWPEYKRLCDHPTVLSRFLIETTALLLASEPVLGSRVRTQLNRQPLPKPAAYVGPPSADMFLADICAAESHAIAEFVVKLPDGAGAAHGLSSLAGVRAVWRELADHLLAPSSVAGTDEVGSAQIAPAPIEKQKRGGEL